MIEDPQMEYKVSMTRIPINDLTRNLGVDSDLVEALNRVIESGWFILGPESVAFENEFARFCGVRHCIGVANGTNALELALKALDVKQGDRVATVANAGMYSTIAILSVGAIPVFLDIDQATMLMEPKALYRTTQDNLTAVIVTHLFGRMADMPSILDHTQKYGIHVIEDCAQAHGAILESKRAGAWGKIGCFSFYPTKNLGAFGDAGAITTNDDHLAEKIKRLRQYGWGDKYHSLVAGGMNSRMDEIQAAILRIKLPHLDEWNRARREIADAYQSGINHPLVNKPLPSNESDVCHLFIIRTNFRSELQAHLEACGITTDVHYPIPDYKQPSIAEGFPHISLMNTEEACSQIITIPCFPGMEPEEISSVINAVESWRPG